MSGESRKRSITQLALAIAQGVSIAAWARANEVPRSTACRWARDPLVRKKLEPCRRRTIENEIDRMRETSTAMTELPRKNLKIELAFAIAQGVSITVWARANGVARNTAYRWARDPFVRKTVERCRRRTIEEGIRRISKQSAWAADGIGMLARVSNSESVKLDEFRTILADMTSSPAPRLKTTSGKRPGFSKNSATECRIVQ